MRLAQISGSSGGQWEPSSLLQATKFHQIWEHQGQDTRSKLFGMKSSFTLLERGSMQSTMEEISQLGGLMRMASATPQPKHSQHSQADLNHTTRARI